MDATRAERNEQLRTWTRRAITAWVLAAIFAATGAQALSFGTLAASRIAPPGGAPQQSFEAHPDTAPLRSDAWVEQDGVSAGAISIYGSAYASVATLPGADAWAASLWTETFTIDASAPGSVRFDFLLTGSLDAGDAIGGSARVSLRTVAGLTGDDSLFEDGFSALGPSYVASVACDAGGCDAPRSVAREPFSVVVDFAPGAPFRLDALLEVTAAGGGSAHFSPSAWLEAITLPEGASLASASGWVYDDLVRYPDAVPEPGTALLLGAGLAAIAARRRSS